MSKSDKIAIAVTGLAWMGNGTRSVSSLLDELLPQAKSEIQITAYRITKGANGFFRSITDCLSRGLKVTLVINQFDKQSEDIKKKLRNLKTVFAHFEVFDFYPERAGEDLHAKIIVIDRNKALVGSSNITWHGFVLNHELGLLVEGPSAAKVGGLIDSLVNDKRTKPIVI